MASFNLLNVTYFRNYNGYIAKFYLGTGFQIKTSNGKKLVPGTDPNLIGNSEPRTNSNSIFSLLPCGRITAVECYNKNDMLFFSIFI